MNGDDRFDLPAPATFSIRPFRHEADFAAMTEVFAACVEADGLPWIITAEEFASMVGAYSLPPAEAVSFAEVDGYVVGYAEGSHHGDAPDGTRILSHSGAVHPAWRGRGIGRALLRRGQVSARTDAAQRPPAPRVRFRTDAAERASTARDLLEWDGYTIVRYMVTMVRRSLAHPPPDELPSGIEARPVRSEDARRIVVAAEEAFRDHWGWVGMTDAMIDSMAFGSIFGQHHLWQVAWEGDEVVGGVLGFISDEENERLGRRRGYTERIFTRRPWRGRGVASALIGRNLRELARRGMTEAMLGVDTENPSGALRLYERLGFETETTELIYERDAGPA